jgi:hypothetical protein
MLARLSTNSLLIASQPKRDWFEIVETLASTICDISVGSGYDAVKSHAGFCHVVFQHHREIDTLG